MKYIEFSRAILLSWTFRLSASIFVMFGCGSSTPDPPLDPSSGSSASGGGTGTGGHGGAGGVGAGGSGGIDTSDRSYTAVLVTSPCDDLSSADVLELSTFNHVTDYMDLPFPFAFFGESSTRFVIAAQGQVYLGDSSLFLATVGDLQEPPDRTIPNGWVAAFWDPLLAYIPDSRGDVRVLHTGAGADERLVMGYNDFTLLFPSDVPNPDVHLSFQVVLLRTTQAIEFRYCQLDPGPNPSQELQDRVLGGGAAIALESSDGARGVSYSFKTPFLSDGIAIRFTPTP
jgi:hypothetical protein